MIPHRTAAAIFTRRPGRFLAVLLAAAIAVLLAGQPQSARAATGDFGISVSLGADRAAYLVRGGLQTCDSSNNCTGGLAQPKTGDNPSWVNTILQVDTLIPDSGFRGTVNFQLSGLPAGVTSQTPASTTIINSTTLGADGFGDTIFGTDTTLQLSADNTAPLGNFPLTVTATSGSLSHSVTITVDVVDSLPATTLARLDVPPSQVNPTFGGTPSSDTVHVTDPALASGTVVALVSSNPAVASVPASVTIPAGATSATFTITTQPVTSSTFVSLSATLNGQTLTVPNALYVEAPPLVKSLTLSPASAQPSAGGVSGHIVLKDYVPENTGGNGVLVALSSSNPAAASVPASVTVTPYVNGNDAFFNVTLANNAAAGPVTISASLNGQTTNAQLTILDQINSSSSGNWDKHAQLLTVTAPTNNPSDTLQVFVSGTTQLIGTMTNLGNGNYQGQFSWPVNPGYVDITSSGGATLSHISILTVTPKKGH